MRRVFAERVLPFADLEAMHHTFEAPPAGATAATTATAALGDEPVLASFCGRLVALLRELSDARTDWLGLFRAHLWAFGPKHFGTNALFCRVAGATPARLMGGGVVSAGPSAAFGAGVAFVDEYAKSFESGFQLASLAGPLCDEPLTGVAFFVEEVELDEAAARRSAASEEGAAVRGQLISAVRDGFRRLASVLSPRLVEPVFACDMHVPMMVLREALSLLRRRRGAVTEEDMRDGSDVFLLKSTLPVVESFGFSESLRGATSGLVSVHLAFSHWAIIPEDPFWVPTTAEELEEHGAGPQHHKQLSRRLVDEVRRRKGKLVREKRVENPEKQRTLGRNK